MIVVPVDTDTTCAIAATYPAKKFGIKTGTKVMDAKQMCPDLKIVQARPRLYKAYHEAIRKTAQTVLPESKVHSIDELSFELIGAERQPENARALAVRMKSTVLKEVGECLTCSVGIAPNTFLAKLATEIEKPNGLVVLEAKEFPGRLLELKLTDFTGINTRMARRLNSHMIFSAKDLCSADKEKLLAAFGSIVGERWWYLLRGFTLPESDTPRKSISQSHVLAPEFRTESGTLEVAVRLLTKAAARLRSESLLTSDLKVAVVGKQKSWEASMRFSPTGETQELLAHFRTLWDGHDFVGPLQAAIVFGSLKTASEVTPSLFEDQSDRPFPQKSLSKALDTVNGKFGKNTVFVGSSDHAKDAVDEKIAFTKTWLFSEGKGDNDWEAELPSASAENPDEPPQR